jgi:prophage DNA circulation protein
MTTWQDRVRTEIKLTSPKGTVFTTAWKGDDISVSKRVGRFSYPGIDKEVAQDMGLNSREFPITLYFSGDDNDKTARSFESKLSESGVWTVVHPTEGTLHLQPLSCVRSTKPVESGSITVVKTNWMEPADDGAVVSSADLAYAVESSVSDVNTAVAESADTNIIQDTVSEVKSIYNTVKTSFNKIKNIITETNADINAVERNINEVITSAKIDILSVIGGIAQIIESPSAIAGSLENAVDSAVGSVMSSLSALGDSIISGTTYSSGYSTYDKNKSAVTEAVLDIVQAGMATAVISDLPETREQALVILNLYADFVDKVNVFSDSAKTASAAKNFYSQYFGLTGADSSLKTMHKTVAKYLMSVTFDLKTERKIILAHVRSPLEIAITEYGATSETCDYYYNLFCTSNKLYGDEQLLLKTGREVIIYE